MKYFSAKTRQKMSDSAKARCSPEWRKMMSERYSTMLDTERVRELYESGMTQDEVAKELGVTRKIVWRHMKNNGIKARIPINRNQNHEQNHMWKGDDASYKAFHLRVKADKGSAKEYGCSVCGRNDDEAFYDWANLTGHYEDINDYAPMCRSCHRQYDKKRREVG